MHNRITRFSDAAIGEWAQENKAIPSKIAQQQAIVIEQTEYIQRISSQLEHYKGIVNKTIAILEMRNGIDTIEHWNGSDDRRYRGAEVAHIIEDVATTMELSRLRNQRDLLQQQRIEPENKRDTIQQEMNGYVNQRDRA